MVCQNLASKKGDRLEPSPTLRNTADFDHMRPEPGSTLEVTFWRRSAETLVRRHNPIFSEQIGLSPNCIAMDWLHILALGIFLYFANCFIHQLVADDVFGPKGTTRHEREIGVMTELKALMIRWKGRELKAGRKHTLPDGLTQGMLGKRGSTLSLSGAEANGFLRFLMQCVVPTLRDKLVGGIWKTC